MDHSLNSDCRQKEDQRIQIFPVCSIILYPRYFFSHLAVKQLERKTPQRHSGNQTPTQAQPRMEIQLCLTIFLSTQPSTTLTVRTFAHCVSSRFLPSYLLNQFKDCYLKQSINSGDLLHFIIFNIISLFIVLDNYKTQYISVWSKFFSEQKLRVWVVSRGKGV